MACGSDAPRGWSSGGASGVSGSWPVPPRAESRLTAGLHPDEAVLHDVDAAHAMLAPVGRTGFFKTGCCREGSSQMPSERGVGHTPGSETQRSHPSGPGHLFRLPIVQAGKLRPREGKVCPGHAAEFTTSVPSGPSPCVPPAPLAAHLPFRPGLRSDGGLRSSNQVAPCLRAVPKAGRGSRACPPWPGRPGAVTIGHSGRCQRSPARVVSREAGRGCGHSRDFVQVQEELQGPAVGGAVLDVGHLHGDP